jgi:hypothetical protein
LTFIKSYFMDLQNTTQKIKDWTTEIPLKTWGELGCFGGVKDYVSYNTIKVIISVLVNVCIIVVGDNCTWLIDLFKRLC